MNAQSLRPKMDQVRLLLEQSKIGILGISETWLHDDDDISIDGYDIVRKDRSIRQGGGVALVISQHINYKVLNDMAPGM